MCRLNDLCPAARRATKTRPPILQAIATGKIGKDECDPILIGGIAVVAVGVEYASVDSVTTGTAENTIVGCTCEAIGYSQKPYAAESTGQPCQRQ